MRSVTRLSVVLPLVLLCLISIVVAAICSPSSVRMLSKWVDTYTYGANGSYEIASQMKLGGFVTIVACNAQVIFGKEVRASPTEVTRSVIIDVSSSAEHQDICHQHYEAIGEPAPRAGSTL